MHSHALHTRHTRDSAQQSEELKMANCDKTHLDDVVRMARLIILAGQLSRTDLASDMLEYYLSNRRYYICCTPETGSIIHG